MVEVHGIQKQLNISIPASPARDLRIYKNGIVHNVIHLGFSMKLTHLSQFNTDLFAITDGFIYTNVQREAALIKR